MSNFKLPETVTIWVSSGSDAYGGVSWTRTEAKARTARRSERMRDVNGDIIDVKLAVYTRSLIPIRSMVMKGIVTDLIPPSGAIDIRISADNETMTDMNVCYG